MYAHVQSFDERSQHGMFSIGVSYALLRLFPWHIAIRSTGGSRAKVTMIFDHFPATSRWRRLQIIIGDGVVRQCAIGGWHGGVRAVTEAEKKDAGRCGSTNLILHKT